MPDPVIPEGALIMDDYDDLNDHCLSCNKQTLHAVRKVRGKLTSTCMTCNTSEDVDADDFEEVGYFPDPNGDWKDPSGRDKLVH